MLSGKRKEEMREILEKRGEMFARMLEVIKSDTSSEAHADWIDIACATNDIDMQLMCEEEATRNLEAISRALRRIDDADFGICTDCACEIPVERLKMLPETRRCTRCQEATDGGA